jgi:hypothetical protein
MLHRETFLAANLLFINFLGRLCLSAFCLAFSIKHFLFQTNNAPIAANNAPIIFSAPTPPASFAKAGGEVVGLGPVRPVLFVKIGGVVGRTQVQVMLAEQGTGPSESVHVTVWPVSKGLKLI